MICNIFIVFFNVWLVEFRKIIIYLIVRKLYVYFWESKEDKLDSVIMNIFDVVVLWKIYGDFDKILE